jgi:hypothetical protein
MHTEMDPSEAKGVATGERGEEKPLCIMTTLYELMAAIQDVVSPDEDALVVATVGHLVRSGRLTWLGTNSTPQCQSRRPERQTWPCGSQWAAQEWSSD